MKKFNQVITVEVAVDDIANQLLSTINESFAHRELLAEAVIGTALHKGSLGKVYNALNGYTGELNFKPYQSVICKETKREYKLVDDSWKWEWEEIGECRIITIDTYRDKPLLVEYTRTAHGGTVETETEWVSVHNCSEIPVKVEPVDLAH